MKKLRTKIAILAGITPLISLADDGKEFDISDVTIMLAVIYFLALLRLAYAFFKERKSQKIEIIVASSLFVLFSIMVWDFHQPLWMVKTALWILGILIFMLVVTVSVKALLWIVEGIRIRNLMPIFIGAAVLVMVAAFVFLGGVVGFDKLANFEPYKPFPLKIF